MGFWVWGFMGFIGFLGFSEAYRVSALAGFIGFIKRLGFKVFLGLLVFRVQGSPINLKARPTAGRAAHAYDTAGEVAEVVKLLRVGFRV